MERLRSPRWRWPAVVRVLFVVGLLRAASATGNANTTGEATDVVPLLDWSEWDDESPRVLVRGRTEPSIGGPTMGSATGSCLPGTCQQQQLRQLVHECSRQLKLPDLGCGHDFVTDDDYRVPYFESLPSCGFEVR